MITVNQHLMHLCIVFDNISCGSGLVFFTVGGCVCSWALVTKPLGFSDKACFTALQPSPVLLSGDGCYVLAVIVDGSARRSKVLSVTVKA